MNILGIGPGELVLILIIAVVVLGPDKLPETMRMIGKTMREIRAITDGFQKELNRELAEVTKEPTTPPASTQPAAPAAAPAATVAADEQPVPINELPPPYGNGTPTVMGRAPVVEADTAAAEAAGKPEPSDGIDLAAKAVLIEQNPAEPAAPVAADGHNGRNEV